MNALSGGVKLAGSLQNLGEVGKHQK